MDTNQTYFGSNGEKEDDLCSYIEPWEKEGGFVLYIVVLAYVFYLMEVLCDEFFVPALNILCEKLSLSDDVAGATFMAAGASSPELFVSLIAVLKGSPVGVGTVVGSELFNMLCICGASALFAPSLMILDWRILVREISFYAISLGLLQLCLFDHKVEDWQALMLLGAYVFYVIVCSQYGKFVNKCCKHKKKTGISTTGLGDGLLFIRHEEDDATYTDSSDAHSPHHPSTKTLVTTPMQVTKNNITLQRPPVGSIAQPSFEPSLKVTVTGEEGVSLQVPKSPSGMLEGSSVENTYESHLTLSEARLESVGRGSTRKYRRSMRASMQGRGSMQGRAGPHDSDRGQSPQMIDGIEYSNPIAKHGFLLKKSQFYSKARISTKVWQKKWFFLDQHGPFLRWCRNPLRPEKGQRLLNMWQVSQVEPLQRSDIAISKAGGEIYVLRANSQETRNEWILCLKDKMMGLANKRIRGSNVDDTGVMVGYGQDENETYSTWEDVRFMFFFPKDESRCTKTIWALMLPFFFIFAITIPDVRIRRFAPAYPLTLIMVVVWLAVLSLGLVNAADRLGCVLGIPPDIMGLTIGSIGTSLPNLFASVLVAKQGLGNMAVSNAFGSNVFNIFVALGFPWMVQTLILDRKEPYKVPSETINSTIVILAAFLLLFVFVLVAFKAKLNKGVGIFFLVAYAVFIVYEILATAFPNVVPVMDF